MSEPVHKPGDSATAARRWLILPGIVAGGAALYWRYGHLLSLETLAEQESAIRQFGARHPLLQYVAALAVYVLVTGLSLPGATVLSLTYGWYFGFARAVVLVSFASTAGATMAFLLSRYLLRDAIQNRFRDRLSVLNENLKREGAFYLFTLRLIPVIPFFVLNVVMGLTPIRVTTFWWVSQLGMLPATIVYVYAGSSVPDLQTLAEHGARGLISPQLLAALALLGLFPLIMRRLVARFRPGTPPALASQTQADKPLDADPAGD